MTDKEIMEILESEGLEKGDCNCAYIPGCGESTKYDSDYIVAEINDYTQTLQFFPELYWDYRDGTVKTGCEKIVLFYYGEKIPFNSDYVPLDETALRAACRFVIKRLKDWQKIFERFSIEEDSMGFKYSESYGEVLKEEK